MRKGIYSRPPAQRKIYNIRIPNFIMNREQNEKLKDIIKEGKWNYIFKYGVIYWGLLTATLFILFNKFILEYKIDSFSISLDYILFGIGGLIVGILGWKNINKKVKQ